MQPISAALVLFASFTQIPVPGETPDPDPGTIAEASDSTVPAEILVDWLHANDFSMIGLRPETYEYHVLCGFRRGFDYLKSCGIRWKYASSGRLTKERLRPHKLLFINLVSAERSPFLVSEIEAISTFVQQGGSLFVVTDHSNCYYHAHRLMPLLEEMEIRSHTSTACELPPHTLGSGNGWITATHFTPHPVARGLRCIAMQSGGCVDDRCSIAHTSDASWADAWNVGIYGEQNAPSFTGNFTRDPDEPAGPLGVVLAKEWGRGRIVIVADQNMLSDPFIHYADNYRLWLNSVAWLLHRESLNDPEPYVRSHSNPIALFEQYDHAHFGSPDADGYYHAMTLLNRYHSTFANDHPLANAALIILATNHGSISEGQRAALVDHLRNGKNLLLLSAENNFALNNAGIVRDIVGAFSTERETDGEVPTRNQKQRDATTPNATARGASISSHRGSLAPSTNRDDSERVPLNASIGRQMKRKPNKIVVELPSQGRIHILVDAPSFNNANLPPPTRRPTNEERMLGQKLLDAVEAALND